MTLEELLARYEARRADAAAVGSTAPLATVYEALLTDLRSIDGGLPAPVTGAADRWLSAAEASLLLGVTPRWLYQHTRGLPFVVRGSRKVVRFHEARLRRWYAGLSGGQAA